jgi:CRISPR-associated protein (TIGR03986 family)
MQVLRPHVSVTVATPDRAGRAPYNFVPLAAEEWTRAASPPPEGDRLHLGCHTGEVELQIALKTDFYTRGMWSLVEYRQLVREAAQALPYMVDGQVRLPGSSLRGMVRTLVEILSFAPMGEINDTQMFFRSVAAVPDPLNHRSFEPQAKVYKDRLLRGQELTVQAGYLYGARNDWRIQPASVHPESRKQWHRYRTTETWVRRRVRFDAEGPGGLFAYVSHQGREEGWLVCSGGMNGKQKQWVVRAEDPKAAPVCVHRDLVAAYKENGVTKKIRDAKFDYTDYSKAEPVFYVIDDRGYVVAFGHTAYMRMPYLRKPSGAVPDNLKKKQPDEWDFVDRMFGRIPTKGRQGARGRVFFEDAIAVTNNEQITPLTGETTRVVLGQPKPTTYQHYLVQRDETTAKSLHWDGDLDGRGQVQLRGHKLYWHRPQAPMPVGAGDSKKDNVATVFQPVKAGALFHARIRFENLSSPELGALLCALALPAGCAHKLGMAKPLGLGTIQLSGIRVKVRDPEKRYGAFLSGRERLMTGERGLRPEELVSSQDAFAEAVLGKGYRLGHLWTHPRLVELRALLTIGEQQQTADWSAKTRYLEFGGLLDWEPGRNYNEYNEVGHPDRPRRLSKRRPLPPASQVLKDKGALPHDLRPRFK